MAAAAMVRGAMLIGVPRGGSGGGSSGSSSKGEAAVAGLAMKPRAAPAAGAVGLTRPLPLSREHSRETDEESVSCCSEPTCGGGGVGHGHGQLSGSLLSAASTASSCTTSSGRGPPRGGGGTGGGASGGNDDPLGGSMHSEASAVSAASASFPDPPALQRGASSPPALSSSSVRCEVVRPLSLSLEKPAHQRTRSAQDIRAHYACRLGIRDPRAERRVLMVRGWRGLRFMLVLCACSLGHTPHK